MALEYDYPLFRPPAEANSIIPQVTLGCSYNNCSFCSMYKTKEYSVKSLEEVKSDIETLSSLYPNATKVFLADGDALALSNEHLIKILQLLKENFPKLRRVSLYASTQNIQAKTLQELELLKANKLNLIYYGIESGSQTVLKKITKGWSGLLDLDLASKVSCSKPYKWNSLKTWNKKKGYIKNKKKKYKIIAIDYGIKKNILRCFSDLHCKVKIVPAETSSQKILNKKPDGIS